MNNPRRVVRALERVSVLGDSPPPPPHGYPGRVLWLGLDADRAEHDEWIAERARGQFESGLLDEAAALRHSYDPRLPAFTAVGYREGFAVVDGNLTRDQALDRTIVRTRQFARRQRTWFRSEPEITWLSAGPAAESRALEAVRRFLGT